MKGKVIINKFFVPPGMAGITLWPFIIFKDKKYAFQDNVNHEQIHIRQQEELLVLPFYVLYALLFVFNLIRMNPRPYHNIPFEKEAYDNEHDLTYLHRRKFWAWLRYF